jgi:urease accessory protein
LRAAKKVLIDLAEPTQIEAGDLLVLEDGRLVRIEAADEELYYIRGRDGLHLAQLCWHIGNRHLAARIEADRILILRDHVIKAMLEGLGASVRDVFEPFSPLRGAYSGHSHDHGHDHSQHHHHGH